MMNDTLCAGLIVPPAAGLVPQDAGQLYADRVKFIARGLGVSAVSPEGFESVVGHILDKARELRDAGAQVISLMGTSISFYKGPEFTEWLRAAMQEATGVPCTTMSHAIVAALRQLGIKRVAVATSYIDELNDRLVDYLTAAGVTVTAIRGMSLTGVKEIGEVPTKALVDLSQSVWREDASAEGVFISCGGLLTLDAIKQLEDSLGLPATASSPAGFWDVMRLGGWEASSAGHGRLFAVSA
jgi:arylmalonate decarboxylase